VGSLLLHAPLETLKMVSLELLRVCVCLILILVEGIYGWSW
jgi:hypothetical protein